LSPVYLPFHPHFPPRTFFSLTTIRPKFIVYQATSKICKTMDRVKTRLRLRGQIIIPKSYRQCYILVKADARFLSIFPNYILFNTSLAKVSSKISVA
jgi:hypothetical protein